ncbi:uncharacterized protein E0L32_009595 [Thyridium curvatum]|uniref:ML-like domain-containing protein n=1 Tax=Thyridium curvatum TaxID=1093900 RepID=A0A507AVE0_9PEZI|nr:uncharacterized protein E0L32_009595 [Thyridium curvatum]TPX08891.1 hypothetical protein E0L32_009595 [Thyridium curvatum]
MTRQSGFLRRALLVAVACAGVVRAVDILQTTGFSSCGKNAEIQVKKVDIKYNNDNKTVSFDVAGFSTKVQNVTAILNVTAYGNQVYSNTFDPCKSDTFVQQLCPVPASNFSARGTQAIPAKFADLVPAIAFQIPDIAAMATLQLISKDSGDNVACIQSTVSNGKTISVPAVSYIAAGVAGAALVMSGVTAVGAAVAGGTGALGGSSAAGGLGTVSPSFIEVFTWFQGMAMNGMLSVNYPSVYRSFTKNFAFSTGLIPWTQLQVAIDDFRASTGGNLTNDNVQFLRNATLVFPDGSSSTPDSSIIKAKRAFHMFEMLAKRQIVTSTDGSDSSNSTNPESTVDSIRTAVSGIQAYVNELSIPSSNTFMTVLLVVAIVIAAIAVGILLLKVILEAWALFGNFPKSLAGFRKHYWGSIARAITSLILLLYGIWVLYCIFQFTHGDSWAAKTLAGITLGIFTAILVFFSFKIWYTARKLKLREGDASGLYEDKSIWVKYSLFYESYRKNYWWIFVPTIVYMFAKGVALAVGDGHGMVQTIALLIIEGLMFVMLLWSRPYERKSGNVINIVIQVVRVLSVVCILVFVEEFGIKQTTQTVTGVVLIAVQSTLTGVLAILIAWNAINACCKENPHRKRRKEMEKRRETDNLTPLDARNSLLLDRPSEKTTLFSIANTPDEKASLVREASPDRYLGAAEPANPYSRPATASTAYRPLTPVGGDRPGDALIANAAAPGRQPTLPNVGGGMPGAGGYGHQRSGSGYSQRSYQSYHMPGAYNNGGYRAPPSRGGY